MVKFWHRFIFLFVVSNLIQFDGVSQDIHFSHYQLVPSIYNPAHTAAFEGDFRVSGIHRNQWKSLGVPFSTFAGGFEQKLFIAPGDIGVGLFAYTDQSGSYALKQSSVQISASYTQDFEKILVSGGLQLGFNWRSFNVNALSYPDQFNNNTGLFDSNSFTMEDDFGNTRSFFDLTLGTLIRSERKWGEVLGGISILHLNSPNESFFSLDSRLKPRFLFESRAEIFRDNDKFWLASLLVQTQNKAQEIIPGFGVGKNLEKNKLNLERLFVNVALRSGIKRNGDAFIVTLGGTLGQFDTAISYDINYSDLNVATDGRGGFEIGIVYRGLSFQPKYKITPCDRY